jgi:hypothetical protein
MKTDMLYVQNVMELAFLMPQFLGYFFANSASETPHKGDIL